MTDFDTPPAAWPPSPSPATAQPEQPPRRRGGLAVVLVAVVVVLLITVGVLTVLLVQGNRSGSSGGGDGGGKTINLSGTLVLTDEVRWSETQGCWGGGGYDDIANGAAVVIRDQAGTVIGTTTLGAGVTEGNEGSPKTCHFAFAVNVPDRPFYGVEVTHRGSVQVSRDDAVHGVVSLTLG